MKKTILIIMLILLSAIYTIAEDVCGNTYSFFYNDVNYLMKFENSNPELPCTSGKSTLYWYDMRIVNNFTINSKGFITVNGVGKFVLDNEKLYFLDTTDIVFNQL